MSSGATAQDKNWKDRASASEAEYSYRREREQLEAIYKELVSKGTTSGSASSDTKPSAPEEAPREDHPYEVGFGGQEDLEDRYATTSGEH